MLRLVLAALVVFTGCDDGATGVPLDAMASDVGASDALVDALVDAEGLDAEPDTGAQRDAVPPAACLYGVPPEAGALVSGEAHVGTLCPDASAWFALTVPADHELTVLLEFTHVLGDLELRLFADDDLSAEVDASASATDRERVGLPAGDAPRTVLVEVYGYRGVGGSFRLTGWLLPVAERVPVQVEGQVTYADRAYGPGGMTGARPVVPARRVVVQARRVFDGAVVAESLTDLDGDWSLDFAGRADHDHEVVVLAEARAGALRARARDRSSLATYALVSEAWLPDAMPEVIDLHADGALAISGALNIADVLGEALAFVARFSDAVAPRLTVSWAPGRPYPCGSCYANDTISLGGQLEDPDEFDDDIILHEFGHWFVDHFSYDNSPGGSHRDQQVPPTLAYGEGLAYFFAAMVREGPHIVDTFLESHRHIDLEKVTQNGEAVPELEGTSTGSALGLLREEVVGGVLWDAYDAASAAEPFDTVAIGAAGHMAILLEVFGGGLAEDVGARGMDLADWVEALVCEVGPAPVQSLVDDRGFPWQAGAGACAEKWRARTPFVLRVEAGWVWVVPVDGQRLPPLAVRVLDGHKVTRRVVACASGCAVAPADASLAVVVGAPDVLWAGASWLGKRFAEALPGGVVRQGLRRYR